MNRGCVKNLLVGMLWVALAAPVLVAVSASNNTKSTIFRIGEFDHSPGEFAPGSPTRNVNFIVSQSDPAKDWFGTQPAVLSSASKSQQTAIPSAPRAITFSLQGVPASNYELHIALLAESPSVPAVKVVINGKAGMFYLHPVLDYNNGDQWDSFDPAYSSADVDFAFPGSYLRSGVNTITLEVIEQAAEAVPGAGLSYDAIELDSVPKTVVSRAASAQLVPTIFYQQQNGELLENLDAFIRHSQRLEAGDKVELNVAQRNYRVELQDGYDFGDEKVEFQVHEFNPITEATLTVGINGREQHFKQTISPAKKWTVFVVPDIHVDVGYSDFQAKVAAIQSRTIGEADGHDSQNIRSSASAWMGNGIFSSILIRAATPSNSVRLRP